MDFSKITENKPLFYGIIGGAILIVAIIIMTIIIAVSSAGSKGEVKSVGSEPLKSNVELLTTDNIGKALEIQAMLAKQGIVAERSLDGTKSKLFLNAKKLFEFNGKMYG